MKRFMVYLELFNDNSSFIFSSDKLEDALRYIADGIEDLEYPDGRDNSNDLCCYHLYDSKKTEDDGEGNMLPMEVFCTDYFYK